MRINRFVATATGMSRRAADAAIADGRVSVDGQLASAGLTVAPGAEVRLDGAPLALTSSHTYLMLHKPAGYVSSRTRQGADPTLYDLLPSELHRLKTVGRLDRDSSGLILLTDDGEFIQRYTHPSHEKTKIYELTLARPLTPADRTRLEQGIKLSDGPSRVRVLSSNGPDVTVSLSEGRNRQLRRTFGALGYTVERLHRTAVGNYRLGELKSGAYTAVEASQP